jgi:A/G-specific adenine glycosylase
VKLATNPAAFQEALRKWYRQNARPLPWREAPSLYKTVVSEFMLQQTQVKTVLPYFARWLAELPDFEALAAAEPARVLKLWEGLGYYSRARNLHRLAQAVAALPQPPESPAAWRELPGVGPYTAAAISSIAGGARVACVDGNVVRILARLTADEREFRDGASAAKAFAPLADALIPAESPGDHNQAMMELGATVCTRGNPRCPDCPVRRFCAGYHSGQPEAFPRLIRRPTEEIAVVRVWSERGSALLLHRAAGDARRLAHLHELPTAEQAGLTDAIVQTGKLLARKKRSITRLVWVAVAGLDSIALSGPHRRWVKEILAARAQPPRPSR